jgi:hypothetical protein
MRQKLYPNADFKKPNKVRKQRPVNRINPLLDEIIDGQTNYL